MAIGDSALAANTSGKHNITIGPFALTNTTSINNTAVGYYSLYANTTGKRQTAIGVNSLKDNTSGDKNTACGFLTLGSNIGGSFNTALGHGAYSNGTGYDNSMKSFSRKTGNSKHGSTGSKRCWRNKLTSVNFKSNSPAVLCKCVN